MEASHFQRLVERVYSSKTKTTNRIKIWIDLCNIEFGPNVSASSKKESSLVLWPSKRICCFSLPRDISNSVHFSFQGIRVRPGWIEVGVIISRKHKRHVDTFKFKDNWDSKIQISNEISWSFPTWRLYQGPPVPLFFCGLPSSASFGHLGLEGVPGSVGPRNG